LPSSLDTSRYRVRLLSLLIVTLWILIAFSGIAETLQPDGKHPAVFDLNEDREPVASLDGQWRFQPSDDADESKGFAHTSLSH